MLLTPQPADLDDWRTSTKLLISMPVVASMADSRDVPYAAQPLRSELDAALGARREPARPRSARKLDGRPRVAQPALDSTA